MELIFTDVARTKVYTGLKKKKKNLKIHCALLNISFEYLNCGNQKGTESHCSASH